MACAVALFHLLNLIAGGYARSAERGLDRPRAHELAASRLAASFTPWSARRSSLHAWLLAENRDAAAAVKAYREALRDAPADALLWAEYAQVLAKLGRFDQSLLHATRRATTLAPNSAAIRAGMAGLGLTYWDRSGAELQGLWLDSMAHELRNNRWGFLRAVLARGRARTFCNGAAVLLRETDWCARFRDSPEHR